MIEAVKDILDRAEAVIMRQMGKEKPIELSEADKFALAFSVGVKMDFQCDGMSMKIKTEPCGIAWIGREFLVYTKR